MEPPIMLNIPSLSIDPIAPLMPKLDSKMQSTKVRLLLKWVWNTPPKSPPISFSNELMTKTVDLVGTIKAPEVND